MLYGILNTDFVGIYGIFCRISPWQITRDWILFDNFSSENLFFSAELRFFFLRPDKDAPARRKFCAMHHSTIYVQCTLYSVQVHSVRYKKYRVLHC